MIWGHWGADGFRTDFIGDVSKNGDLGACASRTKSYHNGGVEGRGFNDWYDNFLAKQTVPEIRPAVRCETHNEIYPEELG